MNSRGERISKPGCGRFSLSSSIQPGSCASFSQSIRAGLHAGVVAFEGLDERLANTVILEAPDRGEARHEEQSGCEVQRLAGGVGRKVVGRTLHGRGRPESGEAPLHAGQNEVAHHFATGAARASLPDTDFAVAVSTANTIRTTSPFQWPISSASDDHVWLDAKAMTVTWWTRAARCPAGGSSSLP